MPNGDMELKYNRSRAGKARPRHTPHAGQSRPALPGGANSVDVNSVGVGTVNADTVDVSTVEIETLQKRLEDLARSESAKDGKIEKLAAQFLGAQRDLDLQKWAREQEVAETAIKFSQLTNQLGTVSDSLSSVRKVWRWAVVSVATMAIIAVCVISWRMRAATSVHEETVADAPIVVQRDPAPSRAVAIAHRPLHDAASQLDHLPPGAEFTAALDRLDEALAEFPNRSPEELLREASGKKDGCRLRWNDKLPSLFLGDMNASPNALASALLHCAEAVSKLH
jgi:hypothetical protein